MAKRLRARNNGPASPEWTTSKRSPIASRFYATKRMSKAPMSAWLSVRPMSPRGANQPVKYLDSGRVEITSQNHGFAVEASSLPSEVLVDRDNLNDQTVEGFRHKRKPIFCVQYHPEASPGPHDSTPLFARLRSM